MKGHTTIPTVLDVTASINPAVHSGREDASIVETFGRSGGRDFGVGRSHGSKHRAHVGLDVGQVRQFSVHPVSVRDLGVDHKGGDQQDGQHAQDQQQLNQREPSGSLFSQPTGKGERGHDHTAQKE